ncbi:MAG: 2-C-methyl-D-erythritol 2,4-cyclodiphosphate synthase [Dysgonamonadaceae bacterium]|jgi:2-C-methyl-D-erythritol 2,4-cyclodiphosphate synthase|nr:2-C-methyl-D-erythritol 2,4-cyclodiphosphate synthase [Dysgonamonadaceae bacterium]
MTIRTGLGFDVHPFKAGRELWLGGIRLDYENGLDGHSDADVLIHALCDALLGAAGLRDIGFHFPDTDEQLKQIDSKILLHRTLQLVRSKGYEIGNVDATVCAEYPKLNPFIPEMISCLAEVMQIDTEAISIKATTSEKMGYVGRGEGVFALASVLITKQ